MLLLIYTVGVVWSTFLPRQSWVEGTRLEALGPVIHLVSPGLFQLKKVSTSLPMKYLFDDAVIKHVITSIIASAASYGTVRK